MSVPPNLTARLISLIENITGYPSPNSLSDVHAAVAALLGPEEAQVSLAALLVGLRGVPITTLADINTSLATLRGVEDATLSDLLRTDEYVNAQIQLNSKLVTLIDLLDAINSAIGGVPYQDLERVSVRGLLYAILNALGVLTTGRTPLGERDEQSNGDTVVSGRRYALFDPPIPDVTIDANGYDLTAAWAGWSAYVQTTAPEIQIGTATDSPNAWLALAGTGEINFSVDAAYPIIAYLKRPAEFEGFYIWTFEDSELESWVGSGLTRYGPITTKYPDLVWNTNASGFRYLAGDWAGWSWESAVTSFSAVYGYNALSTIVGSASGTVPAGAYNQLYLAFENAPSAGWYIKLTPPGAS